ncbi:MAG: glutamate--tRNA ligase [Spirochaetes bacterium]|nr:MAG: glutamate--tRNA ligase [Spirochaetota bacterium]
MSIRVRYAPSPTGLQHIGGVRTALFNYFFARANKGKFILRVEDTDRARYSKEALDDLFETMHWLGISWDEGPGVGGDYGPYFQSQRLHVYREHAEKLIQRGEAYYCFCPPERLKRLREEQQKKKESIGYDRFCRDLPQEEVSRKIKEQIPHVIRLKVPLEGETLFYDKLLGEIKKKNRDLPSDPVLLKSDGYPTYHLANVVDDHLMGISHILRAQEWLPSVPIHIHIYRAFGWEPPFFCHVPMVMGKDGQKLSKRHGSTSIREFREQGYLPEALINYISLVGWSYDDSREFFSKEELERLFTLDRLNKAPGVFDYKKLDWFNGQYIRMKDDEELKALVLPYLLKDGLLSNPPTERELKIVDGMIPLVKERLKKLSEISGMVKFLFVEIDQYSKEDIIPKKMNAETTIRVLKEGRKLIEEFPKHTDEENEELIRRKAEEMGMKVGSFMMPIRVAITGSTVSPPLLGSIRLLGTEKAVKRISGVIEVLKKAV